MTSLFILIVIAFYSPRFVKRSVHLYLKMGERWHHIRIFLSLNLTNTKIRYWSQKLKQITHSYLTLKWLSKESLFLLNAFFYILQTASVPPFVHLLTLSIKDYFYNRFISVIRFEQRKFSFYSSSVSHNALKANCIVTSWSL